MRIIGHRGARGEAPENTLAGFQYIHDLGIRAVEFDVRQLKDDELIIMGYAKNLDYLPSTKIVLIVVWHF